LFAPNATPPAIVAKLNAAVNEILRESALQEEFDQQGAEPMGGTSEQFAGSLCGYRSRISGPLIDRIDLHVDVPALRDEDFGSAPRGEASSVIRERVSRSRARQLARQGVPNARIPSGEVDGRVRPDQQARLLLRHAAMRLGLSARAHHRVLKIARTLADLEGRERVNAADLSEALRYRGLQGTPARI
jgi:magnesium chelatase family protein